MNDSIGPYRSGEIVRRGEGWLLARGAHETSGAAVWLLRLDGEAPHLHEVRRRIPALRELGQHAGLPAGLAPSGRNLLSITEDKGFRVLADVQDHPDPRALATAACRAVSALHEKGLVHGQLSRWFIDVNNQGVVRIRGVAELAVEGDSAEQDQDARALGRLLRHALRASELDDECERVLLNLSRGATTALAAAEVLDSPDRIPERGEVAGDDRDLIAALRAPRNSSDAESGPRRTRDIEADHRRRGRALAGLAAVLVGGLVLSVMFLRNGTANSASDAESPIATPASAAQAASSSHADPKAELTERIHQLYQGRSEAICENDRLRLATIYSPGAPMLAQDESLLATLAAQGARLEGFEITLVSVIDVTIDGSTASARVIDKIPAFEIVALDGSRMAVHERAEATVALTMVSSEAGWVIVTAQHL